MNCYKLTYKDVNKNCVYVFANSFSEAEEVFESQYNNYPVKAIEYIGEVLLPNREVFNTDDVPF